MFKENVHCFPENVIKGFYDLLMNERVWRGCIHCIGAFDAGQGEGHGVLTVSLLERGPNFGIAFGRTESHDDVFGTKDGFKPRPKQNRQIQRGQGALAYDHRMNKFDRHVLRIGRIRPTPESKQASSAQKSFRHLAASLRQATRFPAEEILKNLVPLEQSLFDLAGQSASCCHINCPLTDPRQRITYEHVYDAAATVTGSDQD